MGILDDAKDKLGDAKDKLGDAAGWVKDRAEHIGDQAQDAGQTIGMKAADAKHWVEQRVGSIGDEGAGDAKASFAPADVADAQAGTEHDTRQGFSGGGGEFADAEDDSTESAVDAADQSTGDDQQV